jgi:3-hydroxyisobutyrate dehydrogenase-like beta-hydroxyacid dehydrogenase
VSSKETNVGFPPAFAAVHKQERWFQEKVVLASTARSHGASSQSVSSGPGVLTSRLAPELVAIECSTLSYDGVLELTREAQACNLSYIDAGPRESSNTPRRTP